MKTKGAGGRYYLDLGGVMLPLLCEKVNSAGRGLTESLRRIDEASETDGGWITRSTRNIKYGFHQIST